jgi:hypothetical protein
MTAPASPFVLLETPYGPVSVDARTIVGTVTQPAGEPWRVVFESHPGPIMDLTFFDGDKAEEAVLLLHAAREAHDDQRAEDARARVVGEAIREGAAEIGRQVAEAVRKSMPRASIEDGLRGAASVAVRDLVLATGAHGFAGEMRRTVDAAIRAGAKTIADALPRTPFEGLRGEVTRG